MKKVKRADSAGKQKKRVRRHRRSMILISAVVMLMSGIVFIQSLTLQAKSKEYKQQEIELQKQIDEAKAYAEEIKEFEQYVGTDEYVKDIAQERLGLVNPNEIIFKPSK